MKNKVKTYVLLVVVLAIWGNIGFKVWDGLNDDATELIVQNSNEIFKPKKAIVSDTFSIQNTNRDPFLGTIEKQSKSKKLIVSPKAKWMPIVYNGNFKNNATGEYVYVLKINHTEHLLKRGSEVEDVTLIKGNSKNVVVRYKGEQKTIKLQE